MHSVYWFGDEKFIRGDLFVHCRNCQHQKFDDHLLQSCRWLAEYQVQIQGVRCLGSPVESYC